MSEEEKNQGQDQAEAPAEGQEETQPGMMARATGKVADTAKAAATRVFGAIPTERPSITPEQMYEIANAFSAKVFSDPEVTPKLLESNMIVSFKYYDERWEDVEPEVTIDCSGDEVKFYTGPCDVEPVVTMRMHADTAHRFWKQKVNMMAAVTKGEISAKGPVPKVMKLLPIIKPSYGYYKETLEDLGLTELLNYPPEEPQAAPPAQQEPSGEPQGGS